MKNFAAIDGPPDRLRMATMDGSLSQVIPQANGLSFNHDND